MEDAAVEPLLELEDLVVDYGRLRALAADRVRLERGIVGLLGPNGAGKSTLLRVLMGLQPPNRGRGRLLGLDILSASSALRARLGYMSENEAFVPGLSGIQFVILAAQLAGLRRRDALRRSHEVLSWLGLEELRYRRLDEYPTGLRQRLKLAQALVHDPELLILDEPTSGLDPQGREAMLGLIASLGREHGKSVILSTHLLEDVERVCESVLILDRGRALACGPLAGLRGHWRGRWRLELEGDGAGLAAALAEQGVRAAADGRSSSAPGAWILETPDGWSPRRLFALLAQAEADPSGPRLRSFRSEGESLEQVFARIVQGHRATAGGRAAAAGGPQP